jgi:hypothetical protein
MQAIHGRENSAQGALFFISGDVSEGSKNDLFAS